MLPEIIAQPDLLARLIDEPRIQRKLLVEMLPHLNPLQHLGQLVSGIWSHLFIAVARDLRRERGGKQREAERRQQPPVHPHRLLVASRSHHVSRHRSVGPALCCACGAI
jgi:hypothetical protein